MPTETAPRCLRCATPLRNARTVCPSCGMTVGNTVSTPEDDAPVQKSTRRSMCICPVCSKSILTGEVVEFDGQQLCATCAESLRAKAQRRQAAEKN